MSARVRSWLARRLAPGARAGAVAPLLAPFSRLYELGAHVRTVAYETAYLRTRRLDRPVISVGNITLGGTGKTPIVAMLAEYLRDQNYTVVVLTRGYGRRTRSREVLVSDSGELPADAVARVGDEPALLAREVPGVAVVADADRYAAGLWATHALEADVFLLDDGFQHLSLARDLDLLVVDATDPFGSYRMPPLGRLREPLQGVRRADAVVVTRADRTFDEALIRRVVAGLCGETVPIFYASHDLTGLRPLGGGPVRSVYGFRTRRVGVVTAIGNPGVLLDDLERAGIAVADAQLFADHHDYTQSDLDRAIAAARAAGAEALLTTEKDAVKLERLDHAAMPVLAVRIRFQSDSEAMVKSLCLRAILGHERANSA